LAVASNLLEHSETYKNCPENIVTLPRIKNTLTGEIFEYVELMKMRCRNFRDPQNSVGETSNSGVAGGIYPNRRSLS